MFAIKSDILWFFIFIHVSMCERRILDGIDAKAETSYVVYLVKGGISKSSYDTWLCGGALVTNEFVVTSAACIKDIDYIYVIAGYRKYIADNEIENDPCTSKIKKKVTYTCYPRGYELRYDQLDVWSLIDIAVAKVESPYNFLDDAFKTFCSYAPSVVPINYDAKYQAPGTDAVVFGWGHRSEWRKQDDKINHNQKNLNYAPVKIMEKEECKSHYEHQGTMPHVIDTYMICTLENGTLDDFGERLNNVEYNETVFVDGCAKRKSSAFNPDEPIEECVEDYQYDETRREIQNSNHSSNNSVIENKNINNVTKRRTVLNKTTVSNRIGLTIRSGLTNRTASIQRTASFKKPFVSNETVVINETIRDTRRYGICQNDHGGPLVTWVGAHPSLIGVASVFKVTESFKCAGPYLYTSTQCNGAFLDCILNTGDIHYNRRLSDTGIVLNSTRRSFCQKSIDAERHFTVERHISWLHHPAGPADHERHLTHGKKGPDVNERAPGINEEKVNESERNVNLANNINPSNTRHPLNEKFSVNVNNEPDGRYTANNKHVPNENNGPNINENGAPNNNYMANYHFAPGVPMVANNKYIQYDGPAPNNKPAPNNNPVQNNGPAQNDWPTLNYKSDQFNYHAPNNNPALNQGSAQKYEPAQNNGPAQNNRPDPDNSNLRMRPQIPIHF